nr:hypothetical protein [Tanacetum cinerariifolium]
MTFVGDEDLISGCFCDSSFLYPQSSYHFKELRCCAQCLTLLRIFKRCCIFRILWSGYLVHRDLPLRRSSSLEQLKIKSIRGMLLLSWVRFIGLFPSVLAYDVHKCRMIPQLVIILEEEMCTSGVTKTPSTPRLPNPQEQQGESSVQRKSTIIRIPRRKQPDPITLILTSEQIDVDNLDDATQVRIVKTRSIEDYKARHAVKKDDKHLMDEDIKKLVKGDEIDTDKFADDMLNSQEDLSTRIDLESHKESPEAEKVADYMKGSLEIKDTPITTPTRYPMTITNSLYSDKEKLKELIASKPTSSSSQPRTDRSKHIKGIITRMSRRYGYIFRHMKKSFMPRKYMDAILETVEATLKVVVLEMVNETTYQNMKDNHPMIVAEGIRLEREKTKADIASIVVKAVDAFLQNYMNNNILHVHPTVSASSSIPDLQQQLYLKMKDDEQAKYVDFPLWLALMYKFEKPAYHVGSCRVDTFRSRDHKEHHDDDDHPEGESSAQEQPKDFDPWSNDQGTNNDEVPSEEVSTELVAEISRKGMKSVPTGDDLKQMQDTLSDMMRSRCDSREEHRQLKKRDNPEEVYTKQRIIDVIRVRYDQGYGQEYIKEIMVKRADETRLLKSLIVFIRSCVVWEKVYDYQLGLENYQVKVNLTTPNLIFHGIEEHKLYTITSLPFVGLIYENKKKEKRIMEVDEIPNFYDATLKGVLKEVKKINLDVKHGYADPTLSKDDADFKKFYKAYIQERLRHHDHMRC